MENRIKTYLSEIEEEKNIKILLACETGSRAWGFPSPDSDYDVRIIYMHKTEWYLSLNEQKDTIERMLDNNEIDITGWELRKTLRLLLKSNPALLERLQSSILYKIDASFLTEMQNLAGQCYSRISTMHHYLSMSKKCFAEVKESSKYKLKKMFYALRASMACKWILENDEMPPISFLKMMDGVNLNKALHHRILELIELKATKSESYFHTGEEVIFQFIEDTIEEATLKGKKLPAGKGSMELLNTMFRKTLVD